MPGRSSAALLGELARPIARSWWTVVAGACLGLAAGLWTYDDVPARYRASVRLRCPGTIDAHGLRATATRPEVLESLGGRDAPVGGLAAGRIAAHVGPAGASLIVSDRDATRAAQLADALVRRIEAPRGPCTRSAVGVAVEGPIRPPAAQVYLLGLAVGLATFVGPHLVRAALDPVVCGRRATEGLAGTRVLAVLPRFATPEARLLSRRRLLLNAGLSLAALALFVTVALVHAR